MTDSIPALNALAYIDKTIDNVIDVPTTVWRSDEVVEMLRELRGMIPLSAPSGDDREARSEQAERIRVAVAEYIRGWYTAAVSPEVLVEEMAPIWEAEFRAIEARRPSPVTREALEEAIERGWYSGEQEATIASETGYAAFEGKSLNAIPPRRAAEAVQALLSLPEPAEVEWEYGTEWAIEYPAGIQGVSDDQGDVEDLVQWVVGGYLVARRVGCSPWVPVKGEK